MRLSLLLLAFGVVTQGLAIAKGAASSTKSPGQPPDLRSGAGYLMGFVIGAVVRLWLKVSLLLGAALRPPSDSG